MQFFVDVPKMGAHSVVTDFDAVGDFLVAEPLGKQIENLGFALVRPSPGVSVAGFFWNASTSMRAISLVIGAPPERTSLIAFNNSSGLERFNM